MTVAKRAVLKGVAKLCNSLSRAPSMQRHVFNAMRLNRPEINELITNNDIRFLSYCLARRDQSRSQILQDLWVCFELGEKRNGFFVEFGATNGLKNSNTWLLENAFGWTGILAEPNPVWHSELKANRTSHIETQCVYAKSGEVVPFIATDDTDPELSGIANFSESDHFASVRRRGTIIEVPTISLDDLLDKFSAPRTIDYMSIDTEGSELNILSSYSFKHQFRLISVENNKKNEGALDALLHDKGYIKVFPKFSQWDSWYVARDLRDRPHATIFAPDA